MNIMKSGSKVVCQKCFAVQSLPVANIEAGRYADYACVECSEKMNILSLEIVERRVLELKCWPDNFRQIKRGVKTCDIRVNDRGYKVGDTLHLREWIPSADYDLDGSGEYTGHFVYVQVKHVVCGQLGIPRGLAVLSISSPQLWRNKILGKKTKKVLTV